MKAVLVMLFLIYGTAIFAESQTPPPSGREKIEQPDTHPQKKNETPDQLKICAESLAATNKLLDAQGQEKTADKTTSQHEKESLAKWWEIPNIWVAIFTGILAFTTSALAYFTLLLWRATKTMVDKAALTSIRQAAETKDALEISRKAANAAIEQAKTSTDALQRSNRAWIGLTGPVEIVAPLSFDGKTASCKIRLAIKNVGKSPAVNTCSVCTLTVGPYPPPDPRTYTAVIDQSLLQTITNWCQSLNCE